MKRCFKLDRENELYLKRQDGYKEASELCKRDLANTEEKFRQSQLKVNAANKSMKDMSDEVRELFVYLLR